MMKRVAITIICAFSLVQGGKVRIARNGNSDPSEAPAICAAEGSDGILVAHENCNQFYKCSEGLPVVVACQPGLLYRPDKEWCDWADSVDCGNRIIPDSNNGGDGENNNNGGGNNDPSQAPVICEKEGSDGTLIAHENCNQFYKCSEGLPVAVTCQPGLLYRPDKEWCDWADNVDCGNRIIPDSNNDGDSENNNNGGGNDDSSQAAAICSAEGSDGILIAHENCNQFYKCSEGLPAALTCQPGLLYNPASEWCDWPQNVDCGNRIIS